MTSRERILSAMGYEEVDYVPLSIYFNPNLKVKGYDLSKWQEHIRLQYDLGGDPVVNIRIENSADNLVERRCWRETLPEHEYPVQFEEFKTPAGKLKMGVKVYENWPVNENRIPWGDESASNMLEPLIKSPEDVRAFSYIHKPPGTEQINAAAKLNEQGFCLARRYKCATVCHGGFGLATYLFIMGAEQAVLFSMDYPEAFSQLAQIDHEVNIGRIKAAAELGADIIKRFGGYEQTNLYNPSQFRKIIKPLLKREVATAHEFGLKIYYRVVTGASPLLEDFANIGFDCIEGGEPRLDPACSFNQWAQVFKGKCCCWTGVSSPYLLGRGTTQEVRNEVNQCLDIFGEKGFILGVTNSIRNHFKWENTLAMIDEWKKLKKG